MGMLMEKMGCGWRVEELRDMYDGEVRRGGEGESGQCQGEVRVSSYSKPTGVSCPYLPTLPT
jgi:hypothetical protein